MCVCMYVYTYIYISGIMQDICQSLTPQGAGAAVGISVVFRDERAAGNLRPHTLVA